VSPHIEIGQNLTELWSKKYDKLLLLCYSQSVVFFYDWQAVSLHI